MDHHHLESGNSNPETKAHHRRRGMAHLEDLSSAPTATDYAAIEKDGVLHSNHHHAPPESHTRSLLKGLTWRILATSTTTVIAYFITGHVEAALQIGAMEFFCKLLIYYAHERIWTHIRI